MVRLLIVVLIIGATLYLVLDRQKIKESPQPVYQEQLDKVEGLEQQIREDASKKQEEIDNMTR